MNENKSKANNSNASIKKEIIPDFKERKGREVFSAEPTMKNTSNSTVSSISDKLNQNNKIEKE